MADQLGRYRSEQTDDPVKRFYLARYEALDERLREATPESLGHPVLAFAEIRLTAKYTWLSVDWIERTPSPDGLLVECRATGYREMFPFFEPELDYLEQEARGGNLICCASVQFAVEDSRAEELVERQERGELYVSLVRYGRAISDSVKTELFDCRKRSPATTQALR
ncbi:MAG: hypothetical protein GXY33_07180 [Phycisphaerae bacterium]|nr:hypothetical protein [Phycisphaerae bacterium]